MTRTDRTPGNSGFTLIEVMVALSIMALMMVGMYSTLDTTLKTREMLTHEVKAARMGPQILELIENDLRRAWVLNIENDVIFHGESRTLMGESADSLVFLTTVDSGPTRRVGDREVPSDVCETGYRLRSNPDLPDVLELWRRQSFHVDEDPLEDGAYTRVHDRVVSLQFRYYEDDDTKTEPLEEWDATARRRLPSMVSVKLGLEVGPRTPANDRLAGEPVSRTYWYERMIPLQRDSALALRVHPLPPTFSTASGQGNAGGNPNDIDGDGIPNAEDDDADGDGVSKADDPNDLDPNVPNPGGGGSSGFDDDDGTGGGGGSPFDDLFPGGGGGGGGPGLPDDLFGGG